MIKEQKESNIEVHSNSEERQTQGRWRGLTALLGADAWGTGGSRDHGPLSHQLTDRQMWRKANVSDSVVTKVRLPKCGVRGETARTFIDMNPLSKRREAGGEPLKSGEAGVLFEFPQNVAPSNTRFVWETSLGSN